MHSATATNVPLVTFVVPCYRLAHLLPECVRSIMAQSYRDYEILIMDDCSPDNTEEVAQSFQDDRIRYVRNESNLGHIRNFNKGIGLARGKYIWLISADDYLYKDHVLARYVDLLEKHPQVGYVICPGYGVRNGVKTRPLGRYRGRFDRDQIIPGHRLIKRLIHSNFILTPSGLVRRECYKRVGLFDPNMPWVGDWYLWCLFALHYDVGYLAEPMICYREEHEFSMTHELTRKRADSCAAEEVDIAWRIKRSAEAAGLVHLANACIAGIASTYARVLGADRYSDSSWHMNFDRMEESLRKYSDDEKERERIRARAYDGVGNECYWRKESKSARAFYDQAVALDPGMISSHVKMLLLSLGKPGDLVRRGILSFG